MLGARTRAVLAIATVLIAGAAQAKTIRVVIDKLEYAPATVEAKVGDTIEWTNKDFLAHTATATGAWDLTIQPHKSASQPLTKAGSFNYFCRFHPNMKGRIVASPGG